MAKAFTPAETWEVLQGERSYSQSELLATLAELFKVATAAASALGDLQIEHAHGSLGEYAGRAFRELSMCGLSGVSYDDHITPLGLLRTIASKCDAGLLSVDKQVHSHALKEIRECLDSTPNAWKPRERERLAAPVGLAQRLQRHIDQHPRHYTNP